jgi:hypothetical protein
MFSEISLPVPSQQMTMFLDVMRGGPGANAAGSLASAEDGGYWNLGGRKPQLGNVPADMRSSSPIRQPFGGVFECDNRFEARDERSILDQAGDPNHKLCNPARRSCKEIAR